MENLYNQKVIDANQLFDNRYLESKKLYLYHFDFIPSVYFINSIDGEKTFVKFTERFGSHIEAIYTYRWYNPQKKKFEFDRTQIILNNSCMLEFSSDYCEILHNGKSDVFIKDAIELVMTCKGRKRRQPSEINLVVRDGSGLDLKIMEVKKKKLNLDLFYEDEFKEVDAVIQKRLRQKNDKGIVLLHGLPGTGKTTYIRYLITKLKKRVLFLSPNIAGDLMNPEFIDLLIDNPNTVLIIEDAENIITDRRNSNNSSVSNLLNISDGLLADFLNVQLVCTFNSPLTMVDNALMRKGRLIAKYEFGKLSVAKSQTLSDHFGFKNVITEPMTVAEISNQHEKEFDVKQIEVIGFRRELMMEN
jgi:ATPase family associated with various cellular activities (AAA)